MALARGVHQALSDFRWLAEDLSKHHARLYEIILLQPTLDSYHDTSGYMCGRSVLPGPMAASWTPQLQPSDVTTSTDPAGAHPIIWRAHFSADHTSQLVSWGNPEYQVTNSDL